MTPWINEKTRLRLSCTWVGILPLLLMIMCLSVHLLMSLSFRFFICNYGSNNMAESLGCNEIKLVNPKGNQP